MKQENTNKTRFGIFTVFLSVVLISCIFILTACQSQKIGDIDDYIDLTSMSSTMVYAYVNDMVNTRPEAYLGKTVKANGSYYKSYFDTANKYYHFVVINDAAACCAQGIEFIYESEYPEENKEIEVTGVFDKYEELGTTYYYLKATELIAK